MAKLPSCVSCFKTCAPQDKTVVPLKRLVSERQVQRLGTRDPCVHDYCWANKTLTAEALIDRAIKMFPLVLTQVPARGLIPQFAR